VSEAYPRFSAAEMERRRAALDAAMAEADVRHVVLRGAERSGSSIAWLTRWPVTRAALVVHTPGERDALFVAFYNHVPNAARMATEADVGYAGARPIATAIEELDRRGARGSRIGIVGPVGYREHAALSELAGDVVDLNGAYTRLRLRKSDEELEWIRIGAELTDRGLQAVRDHARPGVSEPELADHVERAYVAAGGTTHIHYFGATPMDAPEIANPAQWPSRRHLRPGDALTCELSASWWDHPGQVLRTFSIAADPSPRYAELHAVADAAFDAITARLRAGATAAELVEAAGVVDEAGFTIRDDIVHGFVGGYLPPVLGTPGRALEPVADFTFEAGMTVVVQPNVVTRDERAGVQTGELLLVGEAGVERLHRAGRGLVRLG
jgi:Xaa-Pro aminopeptidase